MKANTVPVITKAKSVRNKTLRLSEAEKNCLLDNILTENDALEDITNSIILGDSLSICKKIPKKSIDLLILDPPYNLTKDFGTVKFKKMNFNEYCNYLEAMLLAYMPLLKDNSTVYICGDWKSSASIHVVASNYLTVRNRITWQRDKGRGSLSNWKNTQEDIWYLTKSNDYTFNVNDIKTRKKVIAPYKLNGVPKDWKETEEGKFRDTYPSNLWNDITVPYWSMSENTEHPTQKPEKLIAKLILASSNSGDLVLDPFMGSGTTCVVAKKLNRNYIGIDIDPYYVALSEKRIQKANYGDRIQGYHDGVFWDRNSLQ